MRLRRAVRRTVCVGDPAILACDSLRDILVGRCRILGSPVSAMIPARSIRAVTDRLAHTTVELVVRAYWCFHRLGGLMIGLDVFWSPGGDVDDPTDFGLLQPRTMFSSLWSTMITLRRGRSGNSVWSRTRRIVIAEDGRPRKSDSASSLRLVEQVVDCTRGVLSGAGAHRKDHAQKPYGLRGILVGLVDQPPESGK